MSGTDAHGASRANLSPAANAVLRLAVLASGALLMSLEILGSRVLAPTYGSSIFVWGSLIAVFLAAMAAGAWVGGLVADARPRLEVLAALLLGAGGLTWLVPWLVGPVVAAAGADPRLGSAAAAAGLFFLPTALLGGVPTAAIRLCGARPGRLGGAAGGLYALSTLGSMVGTLGTAFVLVPLVGVTDLLRWQGVALALLAGLTLLVARRPAVLAALLVAAALAGLPQAVAPTTADSGAARTVLVRDSVYHHLRVLEDERARYLYFGCCAQGGILLADTLESAYDYVDYFHLGFVLAPRARRVLLIGLGPGVVPRQVLRDVPEAHVDVVEIDPEVAHLAREAFALVPDPRLAVHVEDARRFLARSQERYDLVLLDAFTADGIPFHLATREFLALVRARLADDGYLVANLSGVRNGPRLGLLPWFFATVAEVFPERYVFADTYGGEPSPNVYRNTFVVAGVGAQRGPDDLARASETAARAGVRRTVADLVREVRPPPAEVGRPLTDDFAPVEVLARP